MSKLEKVKSLPNGGDSLAMLGSVVETQYEVRKTNEILAPLMALPEKLEELVQREKVLQQNILVSQRNTLSAQKAMVELRVTMEERANKQAKALENQNDQVQVLLARQQAALNRHLALPDRANQWRIVLSAVVAAVATMMVVLNASPLLEWVWGYEERAGDRDTAEHFHETWKRMSPEEKRFLQGVRSRPLK